MTLPAFPTQFGGEIIAPGSPEYEVARNTVYGRGEPLLVVRPLSAGDVALAVRYAVENDLVLSVRSGGHSSSGYGTNSGGLVIDLSGMRAIEVLDGGRVRIQGGALWGDIATALQPHGLALTSGDTLSVGVGGLTLGGGVGWLVRLHGLALDSLVEAEVVTADGETVTASELVHPDLFWALRGGGGNFGVVTAFPFQAHALDGGIGGAIQCDLSSLESTIRGWRNAMRSADDRLSTTLLAMPDFGPEMPASVQVLVCWAGTDSAEAEAAIAPLLALPGAQGHTIEQKPYVAMLDEAHPPEGPITIVDNNSFSPRFDDEQVAALVEAHAGFGAAVLMLRSLGGAFGRVAQDATAFAFRDSEVLLISAAFLPADAPSAEAERIRRVWASLPGTVSGKYGNFTSMTDNSAVDDFYPRATLDRLRSVKRQWDPRNIFRLNQNVVPQ